MRFLSLFLLILLLGSILIAQQKYLVTPSSDFIPVGKHDNVSDLITKHTNKQMSAVNAECGNKFLFGYTTAIYNGLNGQVSRFGTYHKDIMGQWYVAKASGTIDTVFWFCNGSTGARESLVYLRIHKSLVGKDWGPGIPPYPPPCQSWGYWLNSMDYDNGIAAFPEDATDPNWISTINPNQAGYPPVPATTAPFAEELWGSGQGYGKIHRRGLNQVGLMITGIPCSLTVGDKFFISFRINSLNQHVDETNGTRTEFTAWGSNGPMSTSDENWPSRNWKFYEHDSGPSNCAGFQLWEAKRGWIARGPFQDDPLFVAFYNFWYTMTVSTNVPPLVNPVDGGDVYTTFDTGDQTVLAEIYDCNPANPAEAGVDRAVIEWYIAPTTSTTSSDDFVRQTDIEMTPSGSGDVWEGIIPGQPAGTSVTYVIHAWDISTPSMDQLGATSIYKVVTFENAYYLVDTGEISGPEHKNISTTGTAIDTGAFWSTRYTGAGTAPKDDGTAGPFSLGGPFVYFGDTMYYAWVGTNGAITLSKTATDTIDVTSNGFWSNWDIPQLQHHHRADTLNPARLPANFISPFWADMIVGDTLRQYGNIRWDNSTFPCEFVVEWDSVGAFFDTGPEADINAFRVVLNRCDGTIKFQYVHTGTAGLDSACLVGIVMDSTELSGPEPGYVFVNRNTYPYVTKPRNDWQITFTPGIILWAEEGWNLLSVASDRSGMSMAKDKVYPGLVSDLFIYTTTYEAVETAPAVEGFWGKFPQKRFAGALGLPLTSKVNGVDAGWNIIGTVTKPVAVASVVQSTPGMVVSEYFPYEGGTYPIGTTTLKPGQGYWVRVNAGGTLTLSYTPEAMPKEVARDYSQINKLTITDRNGIDHQTFYLGEEELVSAANMYRGELPPPAPEFSARYTNTGGVVATYPAVIDEKQRYEYPITISAASYPITVKWEIVRPTSQKMGLVADGKYVTDMEGSGFVKIKSAKELTWKIGGGKFIPASFALGQNYPNPFNPVTKFTVDVPRLTNVDIAVYDILGRKIRTLVSGDMEPGRYENMSWDGTDGQGLTVPTGIYFIRMAAGEFNAVQKVMLMK